MSTVTKRFQRVEVDDLSGPDGSIPTIAQGGSAVSTTATQTLTNKTLTAPTVTGLASTSPTQLGMPVTELTATGTFVPKAGMEVLELNHATVVIAATIAAPVKGNYLVITNTSASGTAAHTVTLTAGDFDGAGGNVATLNAPEETLVLYGVSATRYVIVENIGTIVIS